MLWCYMCAIRMWLRSYSHTLFQTYRVLPEQKWLPRDIIFIKNDTSLVLFDGISCSNPFFMALSLFHKSICSDPFCVKSAQIRSYFWSVFSCIRSTIEIYGVNIHIQSEYRKIRTRNNYVFGHFSRGERNCVYFTTLIETIHYLKWTVVDSK